MNKKIFKQVLEDIEKLCKANDGGDVKSVYLTIALANSERLTAKYGDIIAFEDHIRLQQSGGSCIYNYIPYSSIIRISC